MEFKPQVNKNNLIKIKLCDWDQKRPHEALKQLFGLHNVTHWASLLILSSFLKDPRWKFFTQELTSRFFSVLSQMIFSVLFWAFLTSKGQVKCMLLSMTSVQLGKTLGHSLVKKNRKSAEGFLKILVFENEPFLPFFLTWSQSRSLEFP